MDSTPHSISRLWRWIYAVKYVVFIKEKNTEEMLMIIIIEEKYKSKVDVNNEKNQATSPYVRIQSWRCNLSLNFSAVVLCTVQILSRPKRGRKIQFLINEEKSKKGAAGTCDRVAYVYPKCQS